MLRKEDRDNARDRLGIDAKVGAWCTIGSIPEPPPDIHAAAGGGRLRPASIRPLALLGVTVVFPFKMIGVPLAWFDDVTDRIDESDSQREQRRSGAQARKRRDAAIIARGLNEVFDGDWQGEAGRLLLRWYGRSSHHRRLVLVSRGRIFLLAPPQRVSIRAAERMVVIEEFPEGSANLEDPLPEMQESNKLRLGFRDGSWLLLDTEEAPSDIHRWLRHVENVGSDADQASEDYIEEQDSPSHQRRG